MTKRVLIVAALLACTNPEHAKDTLEDQGYTKVKMTGHAWGKCGDGDSTCDGFTAISPAKRYVSGAVGCGRESGCYSKGCTIRFD